MQARQEKARWERRALLAERVMRARAEGELTAEQERAMIAAARSQAGEVRIVILQAYRSVPLNASLLLTFLVGRARC